MISNKIYNPSYVSLELALNHYGIIPEAVLHHTSITTLKTAKFDTDLGVFSYKSIKPELFWGYEIVEHDNIGIKIADFEKTILDYLYFHPEINTKADFESLRFNKQIITENINQNKLEKYLRVFDNERLNHRAEVLQNYLKEQ